MRIEKSKDEKVNVSKTDFKINKFFAMEFRSIQQILGE